MPFSFWSFIMFVGVNTTTTIIGRSGVQGGLSRCRIFG